MSRTVVRYEGEGKARRPIYADQGPANGAGGTMTLGAHAAVARVAQADASKLVAVGGKMPDGGAGAIERRMATEAQRTAWRTADGAVAPMHVPVRAKLEVDGTHAKGSTEERAAASKSRQAGYLAHLARQAIARPALGSPEHIHASRMRGAVRHPEVTAARRSIAVIPVTEEPVMATEPAPQPLTVPDVLEAVAAAASRAADAHTALNNALEAGRAADAALAAAELEWDGARDVLEAAWRATGIGAVIVPTRIEEVIASRAETRHEQLLNGDASANTASEPVELAPTESTGDAAARMATFAAALAADAVDAVDAPTGGPRLTPSQERVIKALRNADGNLYGAAKILGQPIQSVSTALRHIGQKGGIPIELIPRLPAAFAKYSGV